MAISSRFSGYDYGILLAKSDRLLEYFNRRYHSDFMVVEEPNPPEAIIQSGKTTRWVEVTTAYWSKEFAIDLNSYATEDEEHKPIGNVSVSPDAKFSANFAAVVKKKLEKTSYVTFSDKYGQGYLVVSIQYPFFSKRTHRQMHKALSALSINDQLHFRSIYLAYRVSDGYNVILWRP
jgi:hypothetical protein